MTFRRLFTVSMLPLLVAAGVSACHEEGPGERAGKSLDHAAQNVQDAVDPPGPAQKAGRAVDNALH